MGDAVHCRGATAADYPQYVRFFGELGVDDPVLSRQDWERDNLAGSFFMTSDEVVVGYAFVRPLQSDAHVAHVVVDPAERGRGFGKRLMAELAMVLRQHGCERWRLNVKADNAAALRLYASVGFGVAFSSAALHVPWSVMSRLPVSPQRSISARPPRPDEDAALEAAFDLAPGFLATLRRGSGNVLLRLVDDDDPSNARVGLTRFSPAFPGASPFRLATPLLAQQLVEAMHAYNLPEHDGLQIFVENHAELVDALVSAGARIKMEVLHMRGAIP